jgi:anti-sigma B factor antagonist
MSEAGANAQRPEIATFAIEPFDNGTVVRAKGEIDMSVGPDLRAALDALSGTVWVDLSELTFIDSTGIGALVNTRVRLRESGGELRLVNPRGAVSRVLEIMGLGDWVTHGCPNGHKST